MYPSHVTCSDGKRSTTARVVGTKLTQMGQLPAHEAMDTCPTTNNCGGNAARGPGLRVRHNSTIRFEAGELPSFETLFPKNLGSLSEERYRKVLCHFNNASGYPDDAVTKRGCLQRTWLYRNAVT